VEWVPELAAQIFADVEHPTVAELKALPQGKRESAHRSNLHDDITAVVIVLSPADEKEVHPAGWTPKMLPQKKLKGRKRLENSAGDLLGDMARSDETSTKDEEDLRMKLEERNAHILDLIDVARSFSAEHLRIIFDALDCNPRNGFLSREEAGLLAVEVLGEAAADDEELVDIIYNQMDSDNTSDVSWENFLQFFRVDADAVGGTSGAAVHGFRKIYGLLAEIPLFEGVSMAEYEDLARVLQKLHFKDGEDIVRQGDDGDCMYIIEQGEAYAEIDGVQVMEYAAPRYFGELALRAKQPRAATVKARGATVVLRLDRHSFEWLVLEKKGIRSLLENRSHRRSRVSFEDLPELDATTSAIIDAALKKVDDEMAAEAEEYDDDDDDDDDKDITAECEGHEVGFVAPQCPPASDEEPEPEPAN